jgi:acyl carrier protein
MQYQDAENLVLESVSELNLQLDENQKLDISPDTQLFGQGSRLDSLGLVNLVVLVEEKTLDKFGRSVTIADERAMSQKNSPFRTVRTLSEYLFTLLMETGND